MANKRVLLSFSTPSLLQNLGKHVSTLENELVKIGVTAYGPEYKQIVNTPVFKQGGSFTFSGKTPRGMKAEVASLYERAWRERYAEISAKYAQHASRRHIEWKRKNVGVRPYTDGRFTVYYDTPAKMTGHLEQSVAKQMLILKNNNRLKFANLAVAGGFLFNPAAYPKRKRQKLDGSLSVDTVSYVIRFIDTLVATGVLKDGENLVDFSQQRWVQIAQAMSRYAQKSWVGEVENFFNGWGIRL